MAISNVSDRSALAVDRSLLMPIAGLVLVAAVTLTLGPQRLTSALIAVAGIVLVTLRPAWGLATLLTMLLVQYGERRFERTGGGALAALLPGGEGLLTINNVLGLYLALLLVYHVYRESDWSFLRSRQVQLVGLITLLFLISGMLNPIDVQEQLTLGLRVTKQDPMRMLVTRGLFLLLFVAFVRSPKEFRVLIGVFLALTIATAYSGSTTAITQSGDVPQAAEYRAGGLGVLIETAGNPNRLAFICALALIFIWEHGNQQQRRGWVWVNNALALFLVLTIFLTASRGGVIGLAVTALLLFLRRRGVGRRAVYGIIMALVAAALFSEVVPEASRERLSTIPGISQDTEGEGAGSLQRREYTYRIAYRIWRTAPILGVGYTNWEFMRFTLDPLRSAAVPHNSFLLALCEGGVLTLGVYLALFILTIRQLGALERNPEIAARARADGMYWLISATRISLVTFLVYSLFSDLWELIFFYFLFGLAGALLRTYAETPRESTA